VLPLLWNTDQECLMAQEIRRACLFVCLHETALHQMDDLFIFNTSVCKHMHLAYMCEWNKYVIKLFNITHIYSMYTYIYSNPPVICIYCIHIFIFS